LPGIESSKEAKMTVDNATATGNRIVTTDELLATHGITGDKALTIRQIVRGISYRYKYSTADGHMSMAARMIKKWAAVPVQLRYSPKQHSGNWGPWYHVSSYALNPITGKWMYFGYNRGHSKSPGDECEETID
jgi:hypothetical protein